MVELTKQPLEKEGETMEKSDLKPGMLVKNAWSGNVGEVLAGEDGGLAPCGQYCVVVRCRIQSSKNKGKYRRDFWIVNNLDIVSQ